MTDVLCAVHSSVARDTCARCGGFVCESCSRRSSLAGHCERCAELLSPLNLRAARAQRWASHAVNAAFIGAVSFLLGMLADSLLLVLPGVLLWLLAAALGAVALLVRRGTKAPQVLVRSFAAISLGLVALALVAYILSISMSA